MYIDQVKYLTPFLLLILPVSLKAQSNKIVVDSATNKGILLLDSTYKVVEWVEVTRIVDVNRGWRLPNVKELKAIYERTYDRSLLRSAVVAPGIYYTSDFQAGPVGDTVRIVGMMMGREFKVTLTQREYNNLLLVKDL